VRALAWRQDGAARTPRASGWAVRGGGWRLPVMNRTPGGVHVTMRASGRRVRRCPLFSYSCVSASDSCALARGVSGTGSALPAEGNLRCGPRPGIPRAGLRVARHSGLMCSVGSSFSAARLSGVRRAGSDRDASGRLEHVLKPMRLLEGDEATDQLHHREVVIGAAFPPHKESTEAVMPTRRPLDHPTARPAMDDAQER
jgi:hypothetical protein